MYSVLRDPFICGGHCGAIWGGRMYGNNLRNRITGSADFDLGTWTNAEIKRAITKAVSKDGRKLAPPMAFPYYAKMANNDLDAIVAYLRSLKPVHRPTGS